MEVAIATCGRILASQILLPSVDLIRHSNMVWHVSGSVVFAGLFWSYVDDYWHAAVHIYDEEKRTYTIVRFVLFLHMLRLRNTIGYL